MSLDFYLGEKYIVIRLSDLKCEEEFREFFSINITHNLNVMWRAAGCYDALYNNEGKKAHEIIITLEDSLQEMHINKDKYVAMNPSNGWGDYDGALKFLTAVLKACRENPNSTIDVWK